MPEIIEGKWEDLAWSRDLAGRRIRAVVYDASDQPADDAWFSKLKAWADSHKPVGHRVGDSRDSIYTGAVDDPR